MLKHPPSECQEKFTFRGKHSVTAAKDCHCELSEAISALNDRDCFVVSRLCPQAAPGKQDALSRLRNHRQECTFLAIARRFAPIMFQQLMESRVIDANPARTVKALSQKEGQRDICVSNNDVHRLIEALLPRFRAVAWTRTLQE